MQLFHKGKFQAFAHPASVTGCNTDLKFETLNLAGTPSEREGLCVEEGMLGNDTCFTVTFLFFICSFYDFKSRE